MLEVIQIIELLFRGPSGWLVLGVSTAISAGLTYFGTKQRFKKVRATTHAYLGGEKGFQAQNESDIDHMFASFDRYEKKAQAMLHELARSKGGAREDVAEHVLKVANAIVDECIQMAEMNIAFRTKEGHRQFLDRINERFRRAKQIRTQVARMRQDGTKMERAR